VLLLVRLVDALREALDSRMDLPVANALAKGGDGGSKALCNIGARERLVHQT
jgi:hypothetical protein